MSVAVGALDDDVGGIAKELKTPEAEMRDRLKVEPLGSRGVEEETAGVEGISKKLSFNVDLSW